MLSPEAVTADVAGRNPRRRPRNASEDSVINRQPAKRIRRAGLTSDTFKTPKPSQVGGHSSLGGKSPYANGHVLPPSNPPNDKIDSSSLAIRHKALKKAESERRSSKSDGCIELTRNEIYVVTQLPTIPEALQEHHGSEAWHGEISTQSGYALAITPSQAIVWRYVQGPSSTRPSDTFNIRLLHPTNDPRQPLPIGILVPNSTEPALLVAMPISGKITYWDTLSSAASVDPNRQRQQSVQGVVGGLMSGEILTKITEAEPRGFVVTLSTGRLAHVTVSDPQGKPAINVHFLRSGGVYTGGLLGSLRSVFSHAGWSKDVAAVKPGRSSQRGQRYMVSATTQASFQTWDLNWNGTHGLVHHVDAKDDLLKALAEGGEIFSDQDEHSFEVLDFAMMPDSFSGSEAALPGKLEKCQLLVLTVLRGVQSAKYALVGLTIAGDFAKVDVVHPISCYETSISERSQFRPQVLVPEPGEMAFAIFEKEVVLISLVEMEKSPSSQLQMEAHTLPDPFQDTVNYRKDRTFRSVGCAAEPHDKNRARASCIVMISGFGLVRITTSSIKQGPSTADRASVNAQTKIAQAVFFGGSQQSLLDFTPRSEISFSSEEIEKAALLVSHSIMNSSSAYLPSISPSMEQQLYRRSTALADLNRYLNQHYAPLSRQARWQLLWDAEKMAAAQELWRSYNAAASNLATIKATMRASLEMNEESKTVIEDQKNVFTELVEAMSEKHKAENQIEQYETDGVRHWFIHDIWRLEWVIPWAHNIVELLFTESVEDKDELNLITKARIISEAVDIQLGSLETAFRFRGTNKIAYGFEDDTMIDGVLQDGFNDIPEFWTSTMHVVQRVKPLTDIAREMAVLLDGRLEEIPDQGTIAERLLLKLAGENPRQVQICCQTSIERFRWLKSREDPQSIAAGEALALEHFATRKLLFASMTDISRPDKGFELAEKYRDMDALVELIDLDTRSPEVDRQSLDDRVKDYFIKFGARWAHAYFTKYLSGSRAVSILNDRATFKDHLTTFLRRQLRYAKLSWIHEVESEHNYAVAADDLERARKEEKSLWGQKIALSIEKLGILAAKTKGQAKIDTAELEIQRIDHDITVLEIQNALHNFIRPSVRDALDEEAEVDLAMQRYGSFFVMNKPYLQQSLDRNLQTLLAMQTLSIHDLIDTLTLVDDHLVKDRPSVFMDSRFFQALTALRRTKIDASHKALLEKVIWRRCMIQDDWASLNRTETKVDTEVEGETSATALFSTLREGFRTELWRESPPLRPKDCLEAGTTIESLRLSSHYTSTSDAALLDLAHDLAKEAEVLDSCIKQGRLEEWWKGIVETTKSVAREEADWAGEEEARRREMEDDFLRRLERKNTETYGHVKGVRVEGGYGYGEEQLDGMGDADMDM